MDFSSTDSLKIKYYFNKIPKEINGLTYNKNTSDLKYENDCKIKRCIVPKSYFEGKSGYYFIMHQNNWMGNLIPLLK